VQESCCNGIQIRAYLNEQLCSFSAVVKWKLCSCKMEIVQLKNGNCAVEKWKLCSCKMEIVQLKNGNCAVVVVVLPGQNRTLCVND